MTIVAIDSAITTEPVISVMSARVIESSLTGGGSGDRLGKLLKGVHA
jgi:hypothetical protein